MMFAPVQPLPRLAEASEAELATLQEKTARERAWYEGYKRFATNRDIVNAAGNGALQHVRADGNISPIARFRNPSKQHDYPPFLLPSSVLAMGAVGRLWRQRMVQFHLDRPDIRLAATSFARSEEYNASLLATQGALVSPDSTHCQAAAFDIDASGYYTLTPDSGIETVRYPGNADSLQSIGNLLGDRNPANQFATQTSVEQYDSRVTGALLLATLELHNSDMINRIVEFSGTRNQCVHIAPNPDVTSAEWQSVGAGVNNNVWMG
jgi:hypothetical protein